MVGFLGEHYSVYIVAKVGSCLNISLRLPGESVLLDIL